MASLREEFRLRNVGLGYHRGDVFYRSQWRIPPAIFLIYRIVISVYCTIWFLLNQTYYRSGPINTIAAFLTTWSFCALCLHLLTAAIITLIHSSRSGDCCTGSLLNDSGSSPSSIFVVNGESEKQEQATDQGKVTWYMQMDWMFYNAACPFALLVTALYFSLLYPGIARSQGLSFPYVEDFHIHAFNSIVVITEVSISAIPYRILHVIYGFIFALLYMFTTVFYWAADNNFSIYNGMINWSSPGSTMVWVIVIGFVALPLAHLLFFALYKLRCHIAYKFACKNRISTSDIA